MNAACTPATSGPEGLSVQLGRNAASGFLRFAVLTLIYFITYPYMIHKLGPERFGLWVVALAVGQIIPVIDLGVAGALMKQIPPFWVRGEKKRILELGSTATALLLGVGSLCGAIIIALRQPIAHWLRIPAEMRNELTWLLVGIAAVCLINLVASGWSAVLSGIRRTDLTNSAYTAAAVAHAAGIFVVLEADYGLMGLLINAGLMAMLWLILTWFFLRRYVPGFGLHAEQFSRDDAQSILQYGLSIQFAGAGGFLSIPAIKFILSRYTSLSSVSYFELASGITMQLRSAFLQAAIPLAPAAAELSPRLESEEVKRLYQTTLRLLFLGSLPAFSVGVALAPGFVALWLGEANPTVAATLCLLLLGWFINTLTLPAYFILQGQGLARHQAYYASLQLACTLMFGSALASTGGYYGGVLAMVAALSLTSCYLIWQFHRLSKMPFAAVVRGPLLRVFAGNAVLMGLFFVNPTWRTVSHPAALAVLGLVYLGLYGLLLLILRRFLLEDLQALSELYPSEMKRLRIAGWVKESREALDSGEVSASK
jgi:O-antigen/teichoic acid export membrane protein